MAVQSPPSQQPLEDSLRMGQNVNTETLSMSAPFILLFAIAISIIISRKHWFYGAKLKADLNYEWHVAVNNKFKC